MTLGRGDVVGILDQDSTKPQNTWREWMLDTQWEHCHNASLSGAIECSVVIQWKVHIYRQATTSISGLVRNNFQEQQIGWLGESRSRQARHSTEKISGFAEHCNGAT